MEISSPRGKDKAIRQRYSEIVSKEQDYEILKNFEATKERFDKAMAWYDTNPPKPEQEKFYPHFEKVLVDAEAYRLARNEVILKKNQVVMPGMEKTGRMM